MKCTQGDFFACRAVRRIGTSLFRLSIPNGEVLLCRPRIRLEALLVVVLILSSSQDRKWSDGHAKLVPKDWKPPLEQMRRQLKAEFAASANKSQLCSTAGARTWSISDSMVARRATPSFLFSMRSGPNTMVLVCSWTSCTSKCGISGSSRHKWRCSAKDPLVCYIRHQSSGDCRVSCKRGRQLEGYSHFLFASAIDRRWQHGRSMENQRVWRVVEKNHNHSSHSIEAGVSACGLSSKCRFRQLVLGQ